MRGLEGNILFDKGGEGFMVHRRTREPYQTIFVSFALTLGFMILRCLKTRRHMPAIPHGIQKITSDGFSWLQGLLAFSLSLITCKLSSFFWVHSNFTVFTSGQLLILCEWQIKIN